jgi:hypothetical protein
VPVNSSAVGAIEEERKREDDGFSIRASIDNVRIDVDISYCQTAGIGLDFFGDLTSTLIT